MQETKNKTNQKMIEEKDHLLELMIKTGAQLGTFLEEYKKCPSYDETVYNHLLVKTVSTQEHLLEVTGIMRTIKYDIEQQEKLEKA